MLRVLLFNCLTRKTCYKYYMEELWLLGMTLSGTRDPSDFCCCSRGQVTAKPMFLMAAAIAYRYSHLSIGNDAQHWMKACLKWVIGTVHIRYICLSPLVILEVEDITWKCTFGHITKKGCEQQTNLRGHEYHTRWMTA